MFATFENYVHDVHCLHIDLIGYLKKLRLIRCTPNNCHSISHLLLIFSRHAFIQLIIIGATHHLWPYHHAYCLGGL
jgi:hypothetical protein